LNLRVSPDGKLVPTPRSVLSRVVDLPTYSRPVSDTGCHPGIGVVIVGSVDRIGWHVAEPGNYVVQVALHLAAPLRTLDGGNRPSRSRATRS